MSTDCLTGCFRQLSIVKESVEDDYFNNLPDELIIFIFTKLSTSTNEKLFLDNIKLLARCSSVSKRFNALNCLVPTLLIRHGSINSLYKYCPIILQKFKHIRSLQVTHWSRTEVEMHRQKKPLPIIHWEAAYRPHGYCLAVVSYKNLSHYFDNSQKQQSLMLSSEAAKDDNYISSVRRHTLDMVYLHHMLVSLIKDHKYLQKVVVTDVYNRGMLTLDKDVLVDFKNCTSTNIEQVLTHNWRGFALNLDVPFVKPYLGVVMDNVCFNIFEWWEKATDDHVYKDDGDNVGIPSALPFKCPEAELLRKVLQSMMENPEYVKVGNREIIVKVLSDIKSLGHLL